MTKGLIGVSAIVWVVAAVVMWITDNDWTHGAVAFAIAQILLARLDILDGR